MTRRTRLAEQLGPIDPKAVTAPSASLAFSSYVGDGAPDRSIGVGAFQPTFAWVTNRDAGGVGGEPYFKTPGMAAGQSYGVTAQLLNTGRIDVFEVTGIRIDANPDVNAVGVNYDVIGVRNSIDGIKVLQYPGDGDDNRDVTGVGFDPEYVIVVQVSASNDAVVKAPNFAALTSALLKVGTASMIRIKTLITDGFRIGTSSKVNTNGAIYEAICFKSFNNGEGKVKILQYTGDAVDNRAIVGVGFQPRFAIVSSVGKQHMHKSQGMGAFAKRHGTPTFDTDMIKSFDADGFTLGAQGSVNADLINYSALCLSD